MKKILIPAIIIAILILFGLYCVSKRQNIEPEQGMPDIEQVEMIPEENATPPEENEVQSETDNIVDKTTKNVQPIPPKESFIKKAVKKVHDSITHENDSVIQKDIVIKTTEEQNENVRKYSPEEEEALKKLPRSEEVIVDKEIKVKSSKRYIFR